MEVRNVRWRTRLSLVGPLAVLLILSSVTLASAEGGTWTKVAGPPSANAASLAVAPTDPDQLVLAGWQADSRVVGLQPNVVYISADRGKTWVQVSCEVLVPVADLQFDPKDSSVVYAAARVQPYQGEGRPPDRNDVCASFIRTGAQNTGIIGGGLFRSADGGKTWKRQVAGDARAVAVSTSNSRVVYASFTNPDGSRPPLVIAKSTDRGVTWRNVSSGLPTIGFNPRASPVAVHPTNPNVVLAGSVNRIYRSGNGGASWSRIWASSTTTDTGSSQVMGLAFTDSGTGAVAALSDGLLLSADAGKTWRASSSRGYESIVANPLSPGELFLTHPSDSSDYAGLWRSTDSGRSSARLDPPPGSTDVQALAIDQANPQTLYAVMDNGLWAYTLPLTAGGLPATGEPSHALAVLFLGAGFALILAGLRTRAGWSS